MKWASVSITQSCVIVSGCYHKKPSNKKYKSACGIHIFMWGAVLDHLIWSLWSVLRGWENRRVKPNIHFISPWCHETDSSFLSVSECQWMGVNLDVWGDATVQTRLRTCSMAEVWEVELAGVGWGAFSAPCALQSHSSVHYSEAALDLVAMVAQPSAMCNVGGGREDGWMEVRAEWFPR